MTVIEKIEAQQKGQEGSVAWCVGQTMGSQLLTIGNAINGHRMKAVLQDQSNAKPLNSYLAHVLNELRTSFGIKLEEMGGASNA